MLPLAALLSGDLGTAVAITGTYGATRALAVAVAVFAARGDFAAACDAIQTRLLSIKRVIGVAALVFAAVIVIS